MEPSVTRIIPLNLVTRLELLSWSKSNTARTEYALSAGQNELVAMLWKIGVRAPSVRAQIHDVRYHMKRTGFMGRNVVVEIEGSTAPPLAKFAYTGIFGKGMLKFPDGRRFTWARANVAGEQWEFREADGDSVLRLEKGSGMWTDQTWLRLGDARVVVMPDIGLLMVLGWYLILLMTLNEHGVVQKGAPPSYREFVR